MDNFFELFQDIDLFSRSVLFSHCENNEEGTRNVVAECIGKLTLVDPESLLPQLQVIILC